MLIDNLKISATPAVRITHNTNTSFLSVITDNQGADSHVSFFKSKTHAIWYLRVSDDANSESGVFNWHVFAYFGDFGRNEHIFSLFSDFLAYFATFLAFLAYFPTFDFPDIFGLFLMF